MAADNDLRKTVTELFRTVDEALGEIGHPPEDLNRHLLLGAATWVDNLIDGLETTAAGGTVGAAEGYFGGYEDRLRPAADRLTQLAANEDFGARAEAVRLDGLLRQLLLEGEAWRDVEQDQYGETARSILQAISDRL